MGSQAVTEVIKFLNLLKRFHVDKKIGKFLDFFCIVNLTDFSFTRKNLAKFSSLQNWKKTYPGLFRVKNNSDLNVYSLDSNLSRSICSSCLVRQPFK